MSPESEAANGSTDSADPAFTQSEGPGVMTARRLHGLLIEAMRASDGHRMDEPVTVAEIYQDLVPYRAVRDELGLDLNADYEYAVLRLLAGDDGALRIEPEEARDRLTAELESPHPDVGIFREFAACDVQVNLPPAGAAVAATGVEAAEPQIGRAHV